MGKRYYCDYCDKSFADNPTSRKNHLNGVHHHRNKKAHYDLMRDAQEILSQDQAKKSCKVFFSTGECRFGERCTFSHLTNDDRLQLMESIRQKEQKKAKLADAAASEDYKSKLQSWVDARAERLKDKTLEEKRPDIIPDFPEYKLAECLQNVANLPPSLLPPTQDSFLTCSFPEWG